MRLNPDVVDKVKRTNAIRARKRGQWRGKFGPMGI